MGELGLRQRELIARSRVSKGVVSQLMRNVTPQPRRSARTLEALSIALEWHPQHLLAVLAGTEPPVAGEPASRADDIPARLAAIERQLRDITGRLDEMRSANAEQFAEISKRLADLADSGALDGRGRTRQ
jgi:transcriptional regulator with XRE-family HTH domain